MRKLVLAVLVFSLAACDRLGDLHAPERPTVSYQDATLIQSPSRVMMEGYFCPQVVGFPGSLACPTFFGAAPAQAEMKVGFQLGFNVNNPNNFPVPMAGVQLASGETPTLKKPSITSASTILLRTTYAFGPEPLLEMLKRIGNSFASVPRNARSCGVFRVGERCFSLLIDPGRGCEPGAQAALWQIKGRLKPAFFRQVKSFAQPGISGGGSNAAFDCRNERTSFA